MRPSLTFVSTIAVALASACVLVACGKPPGGPPPAAGMPEVGVITLQPQRLAVTTELPGRTSASLVADVRPQVTGIVKARKFREGGDVKAGETLYQIDPATYQAQYDANVAALAKARASLTTTRLKAQRYKELVAIKAVSQQDYDDAAAALEQGEADVASAKANVETSRINLAYARIEAPISGRIGKSSVTPGALVTANQSTALATIQQLDPIYVDVTQSSADLLQLRQAMARGDLQTGAAGAARVRLLLEDGSDYPLEGKLEFSDITVDTSTGAITLRALFPNPQGVLLPGMYVRAVLQQGVKSDALMVPQQAVVRDGGGRPMVYVVGEQHKLQRRMIETGREMGDQWVVRSGLQAGDVLVVDGLQRAAPGVEVKTTPWTAAPAPAAKAASAR
ncbi:MAG: efflux RND transporter periplasmic adaptor subunit [Pseudacidovorax sp.]|uniref:efflux RND transporter periplasmic adaptor subunit n=1 Tax=Pseudacidovorax sp. TaxID=1934311 RepID=UPI001B777629|nr:efflux RND transporter periplasmic adaptor subunit [Pseudacidovorax sp.]MBP6894560.1 efflux RND transporter periplasmic adaptor subunit [Pseudacidovorax sp.]